jgi:hypothetical protein
VDGEATILRAWRPHLHENRHSTGSYSAHGAYLSLIRIKSPIQGGDGFARTSSDPAKCTARHRGERQRCPALPRGCFRCAPLMSPEPLACGLQLPVRYGAALRRDTSARIDGREMTMWRDARAGACRGSRSR